MSTNLHGWRTDTTGLELGDGRQSTRRSIILLTTEEVEIKAPAQGTVSDSLLTKQPFLTVS
jgi:hypothetical protein